MRGLLNLHKPAGPTSRDLVNRVARLVGRGVKVGHAGTLDPIASGVLVVAVGDATRLIERVQAAPKSYRAVVRLGVRSETLDREGTVVESPNPTVPGLEAVLEALAEQVGSISQVPPQYSALKLGGRRAHEVARAGGRLDLAARIVRIDRISILRYDWPSLAIEVDCGAGTYIRAIARDVGERLGCGGLIEELERTAVGMFRVEDAIDPERLDSEGLEPALRPIQLAIPDLPGVPIDAAQWALVAAGRPLMASRLAGGPPPTGEAALFGPDGELRALAEHDPETGLVHPKRVFQGS